MERLDSTTTRPRASTRPHGSSAAGDRAPARSSGHLVLGAVLQVAAAGLVVATGAIHLYLYTDYFSAVPTIGRLFLANFVVAVVLGVAVLVRPRSVWCLLGAGFCLATLAAFVVSVHWGLFGYQETLHGAWQGRAAVVEVAGAVACVALVLARRGRSSG